jgi:hypothetical protein
LRKRGWNNCGLCPFCKQTEESNNHLFFHCHFTVRIWEQLRDWFGILGLHPRQGAGIDIHDWWSSLVEGTSPHRKGLSSLALLVVWEIWKERNARVFRNKLLTSVVIFDLIKAEVRLWVLAGTKHLGDLMLGE